MGRGDERRRSQAQVRFALEIRQVCLADLRRLHAGKSMDVPRVNGDAPPIRSRGLFAQRPDDLRLPASGVVVLLRPADVDLPHGPAGIVVVRQDPIPDRIVGVLELVIGSPVNGDRGSAARQLARLDPALGRVAAPTPRSRPRSRPARRCSRKSARRARPRPRPPGARRTPRPHRARRAIRAPISAGGELRRSTAVCRAASLRVLTS